MREGSLVLLLGAWEVISAPSSAPCRTQSTQLIAVRDEALRLPCFSRYRRVQATNFSWFRDGTHALPSSEVERIHHHGAELYFLPVHLTDEAVYTCYCYLHGTCLKIDTKVTVYEADNYDEPRLATPIEGSELNPVIGCPETTTDLCQGDNGTLEWYKDSTLIPNVHEKVLRIKNATKSDEGLYTCNCTWMHGGRTFHSSASRKLNVKAPTASSLPVIRIPAHNATETAKLGSSKTLVCVVYFGTNDEDFCNVLWTVNGQSVRWNDRFSSKTTREVKNGQSIYTAVLTISSVTEDDFLPSEFKCIAMNIQNWDSRSVFLKPEETKHTFHLVIGCVLLAFLGAVVVLKRFRIDLILFFRGAFKMHSPEDGKLYDAYVICQRHGRDEAAERKMEDFVSRLLPEVLEKKCGYRLFLHGRDDLPGEDHMELIEVRMKMSSRLLVILSPGSDSGHDGDLHDYGRQVGLHQALVQGEMKVVLIELERMNGYSHLPQGLQHLISKSAPLRWEEQGRNSSSPNSRFWKHVRYLMPARTCKTRGPQYSDP